MPLKELSFSDLYVGSENAWMSGVPGTSDVIKPPLHDIDEIKELRDVCEQKLTKNPEVGDFSIRHWGINYRGSVMHTIKEAVFVLRRLGETIAPLTGLGIPTVFTEMMMRPKLTGLFIIAGAYGQGKTTTASALVAARLARFGGVAVTVEDPPEMPLHGRHGQGICYQTAVHMGGFAHACRQAARWAPSIIFLGEIRDSETAMEALRASINGVLVVCTTHADNCAMAIERIFALANVDGASSDDIVGMLATGLNAVVHQRLEESDQRRQLMLDPLFLTADDSHGARNIIRQRKFTQLKSLVQLQKNQMIYSAGSLVN